MIGTNYHGYRSSPEVTFDSVGYLNGNFTSVGGGSGMISPLEDLN